MDLSDASPQSPPAPLRSRPGLLTAVFVLVVAIGIALFSSRSSSTVAEIGSRAPAVDIELFSGGSWTLADHIDDGRGPVVLNLWASWCGPCRTEMPDLDRFAADTPGVTVVGVAVDDTERSARRFIEELGVQFPTGLDAGGSVRAAYPGVGLPTTYVIDGEGIIRHRIDGRITRELLEQMTGDLG